MIITVILTILVLAFVFYLGMECGKCSQHKKVKVNCSAIKELTKQKKNLLLCSTEKGVIDVIIRNETAPYLLSGLISINLKNEQD